MKLFENQINKQTICSKISIICSNQIRIQIISILLIVNIVEMKNFLMIVKKSIVEMNFVINQTIDFEASYDSQKSASYVLNLNADQQIIWIRNEMIRKSVFRIDILSLKTLIVCINTFSSMRIIRKINMMRWFSIWEIDTKHFWITKYEFY